MNVLIIEDDYADTKLLSIRLSKLMPDCSIISAATVHDAYNIAKNNTFDLIFLDLNLPDGYGIGSVHQVKIFSGKTPIIVITGLTDARILQEAKKAKVETVLVKSDLSDQVLLESINAL